MRTKKKKAPLRYTKGNITLCHSGENMKSKFSYLIFLFYNQNSEVRWLANEVTYSCELKNQARLCQKEDKYKAGWLDN